MNAPIKAKLAGFDQSPEWVEQGFILIEFSVPVGTVVTIGTEYEITEAPAPAASSPVPQAVTGTVAEPAAAPVARDTGMCRCGHPIGEHDADGNGWCTGSTVWVDAQSDWLACDCKGYAPVGGAS